METVEVEKIARKTFPIAYTNTKLSKIIYDLLQSNLHPLLLPFCNSACIIFLPNIRPRLLNARNRMISMDICRSLSKKLDIGDWWLIYMLGRNLDPVIYKDVMGEFAKQVEPSKHDRAK